MVNRINANLIEFIIRAAERLAWIWRRSRSFALADGALLISILCACVCVCWIKLTRSCENETNTRMERKRRQQQLNRNETSWIRLFRVYRNKRMNLKHCHSVYTLACDFVYVEIFISFYLYYSSVSFSHSLPLMSARLVLVVCVRARESIQNRKRMKRRRRRNKKNNKNSDTATQPNDSRRFSG